MYRFICRHKFNLFESKYPRAQMQGHMVVSYLVFKETAKLFSRVTRPFYIPQQWMIQFLCIFSKILVLSLFVFSHSIGIQWYLIADSICISLMPKGGQSWVFIGRADAEVEIPILWPPHVKSWLIGKDPDAGRDWGQEEKWATEDEMAGWHHRLDGHEFE